jgi:hypothetical protein
MVVVVANPIIALVIVGELRYPTKVSFEAGRPTTPHLPSAKRAELGPTAKAPG